ncbi:MAG: TonB-dependent receptor [Deltaproteobacteria bacterium]|nr:TonB-dependent receptor [Deltaproteobacteria bacterium]
MAQSRPSRRARAALVPLLVVCLALEAVPGRADERERDPFAGVEEITAWGVQTGFVPTLEGANTSRIDLEDFVAENKSLADALSEAGGVSVRRFGGVADRAELSIRGATPSQSVVTIDGIRANSVLTGGLDLSQSCTPLLESVEITRGAGALSEGSGAIGGVVNLVTRTGAGEPRTEGHFSGGAFDTWSGSLLHAGAWKDLEYAAGYCGLSTEGDFRFARPVLKSDGVITRFQPDTATRINNERVLHNANLSIGRALGRGRLRVMDVASYSSGGEPGLDSGDGPTAGQLRRAHSRNLSNLVQARWDGPSPTGLGDDFSVALFNRFQRARFISPELGLTESIDLDTRLSTTGLRTRDRWQHGLLGRELATNLGFDLSGDAIRSNDRNGRDRFNLGGFLGEEIPLVPERLVLMGGARLDWTGDFDPKLLPDVALVATPARWLRLKAQYAGSYRAPTFDELYHPDRGFIRGNPALRPEEAWSVNGGVELSLEKLGPFSALRLELAGFHRDIDESITWILISPRTIAPVNTGPARTTGFELGFSIDLTRLLRFSLNHTFIDSERRSTGEKLPGQAPNDTFARLRVGPEDQWKLVGELHRVDAIPVSEGGSRELPARLVSNLSASVNLAKLRFRPFARPRAFWLFFELNNLTDEAVRDSISFPQPGRYATAGFDFRW